MYHIILKFFFRGLCDCPPQSLYTCGRCDEVLPPDQLGKALNVLHESCRNNNVRVHVWSIIYLILLVRSGPVQSGPVWFGLVRSGSERPWFGRSDRTLIWRRLATRISWKRPLLNVLSDSCRNNKVRVHVWSPFIVPFWLFWQFFDCFWGSKWWRLATGWAGNGPQCAQWCLQKQPCLIPPYSRPFYFYSCLFTS